VSSPRGRRLRRRRCPWRWRWLGRCRRLGRWRYFTFSWKSEIWQCHVRYFNFFFKKKWNMAVAVWVRYFTFLAISLYWLFHFSGGKVKSEKWNRKIEIGKAKYGGMHGKEKHTHIVSSHLQPPALHHQLRLPPLTDTTTTRGDNKKNFSFNC